MLNTVSIEERYLEKVDKISSASGCWEWLAAKDKDGYGLFKLKGKMKRAHRVSFSFFVGEILNNLLVLHDCDNPSCVNPDHLHLGTARDNAKECVERNRHSMATKTHCPQGHEYTEENILLYGNKRSCKACNRKRSRESQREIRLNANM